MLLPPCGIHATSCVPLSLLESLVEIAKNTFIGIVGIDSLWNEETYCTIVIGGGGYILVAVIRPNVDAGGAVVRRYAAFESLENVGEIRFGQ